MLARQTLEKRNNTDDSLSQSWASQYNQMDDQQKILSRKMISDILFQGCMGQLQFDHTIQLQNMFNPAIATTSVPSTQFNIIRPTPRAHFINNRIRIPTPLSSTGSGSSQTSNPISGYSTSNFANTRIITVPTPLTSNESLSTSGSEYMFEGPIAYDCLPEDESTTNTDIQQYFSQFGSELN